MKIVFRTIVFLIGAALLFVSGAASENPYFKSMHKIAENGGRPAWSPDGKKIAFDRKNPKDGYYDLWVMNADGSGQTALTEPAPEGLPMRHIGNPSWHPSGKYIIVNAEKAKNPMTGKKFAEPLCEPGIGRNNDLWMISADGKKAWLLWENPSPKTLFAAQPALYNARFSHDGKKIAWTHSPNGKGGAWGDYVIRVADFSLEPTPHIDKKSLVEIKPSPKGNFHEVHGWTRDDRALDVSGNWRGQHEYDQDIGLLDLASKKIRNLTPAPANTWTEATHSNPATGEIVFMSSEGYSVDTKDDEWWKWLKTDYWVMNPDGTGKHRVTRFNKPGSSEHNGDIVNVAAFSWSPDGTKMVGVMNRTPPGKRGALEVWVFELSGE